MAGFAVSQGSPFSEVPTGPVGWAEPVPFFSALEAARQDELQNRNIGVRGAAETEALAARHRQIEQALGRKLPRWDNLDLAAKGPDAYETMLAEERAKNPAAFEGVPSREQITKDLDTQLGAVRARADAGRQDHPVAGFVGDVVGSLQDPPNLAAMALTGGLGAGRSIAARVVAQALANTGLVAAETPARALDAQVAGPAYTVGEAAQDLAFAPVAGAAFELGGSAMKATGMAAFRRFAPRGMVLQAAGKEAGRALQEAAAADVRGGDRNLPASVRGALNILDRAGRDDMALASLDGEDHERGLGALAMAAPPPRLEPDRDMADLFSPEAGGGPDVALYKGRPIYAQSFDPATLATDPARFQYKAGGDAEGVTARLKGVEAWDPLAAGRLLIWEDRTGAQFVADGHQRFGLVKRLNDERGFEHSLDGYLFREADGWRAEDVRVTAALKNIREGSGAPLDAAKVFRDAPDAIRDRSLPVTGDFIHQARGLASLSDEAFGATVNRVIDERYAAEIGLNAASRPDLHMDMVRLMKAADPANVDEARALVVEALQDDWVRHEGHQADLFGYDPSQSAMIGRAKVAAAVKRGLSRDARLFGQLVKNADAIEAGGNALARDANEARLAVDRAALELTAKLALRHGPVGEAMAKAAKAVVAGETPARAAAPVLKTLREALEAGERFDDARAAAIAPEPPSPAAEALVAPFDDPRGEGARAQAQAAPEDLADTPGILTAEVDDHADLFGNAHQALLACVPAGGGD